MNKLAIALGAALISATSALADSSILDVMMPEPVNLSLIDRTATGSVNAPIAYEMRARLGDGSPAWFGPGTRGGGGIDLTATGSVNAPSAYQMRGRLGDGSPPWF